MDRITEHMKMELWKRFSTKEYPAEWDGTYYRGGKLSQRFWEYFKSIELLELDRQSVLLDIGGGSPKTGVGFFSLIVKDYIKSILILDPHGDSTYANVEVIKKNASYPVLREVLEQHPEITHIGSISVFEHMEQSEREGIIKAIDEYFKGSTFVTTFEYHSRKKYFDNQLTMDSTHNMFKLFKNFYADKIETSPIVALNSYNRFFPVPRWSPLALRFNKIQ